MPDITILVVEDDIGYCELLKKKLKQLNVEILIAHTLDECIKNIDKSDIIILDLSLPDSDGIETFRLVKSMAETKSIVVATGVGDDIMAKQVLKEGAVGYYEKTTDHIANLMHLTEAQMINHESNQKLMNMCQSLMGSILETRLSALNLSTRLEEAKTVIGLPNTEN